MKKTIVLLSAILSLTVLSACGEKADSKSDKETSSAVDSIENDNNSEEGEPDSESEKEQTGDEDKSEKNAALDELFEFKFSLDGKEYQLPLSYADMKSEGWAYENAETEDEELEPNSYFSTTLEKGDMWITVHPVNSTTETIKASEAPLCGLAIMFDYADGKEFKIANDITLGKSTTEDVIAAFGEPDTTSEVITKYTYEKDLQIEVAFEFDDNNILTRVSMRDFH